LKCIGKGGVYLESLQPDSLSRIRELESGLGQMSSAPSTPTSTEPPKFLTQFSDITMLKEGQSAHFEARLTPVNDPNLVVSIRNFIQSLVSNVKFISILCLLL
jgi:hypothetical protein